MSRNVEIKIRLHGSESLEDLRSVVTEVSDHPPTFARQRDTYFAVSSGRLKLREITESDGRVATELIAYHRADGQRPRVSTYHRLVPVSDGDIAGTLRTMFDIRGVVAKRREVYLCGQTRVHLDEVDGLGYFIEIEVVLRPDQSEEDGIRVAESLMRRLGVEAATRQPRGYIDMLAL